MDRQKRIAGAWKARRDRQGPGRHVEVGTSANLTRPFGVVAATPQSVQSGSVTITGIGHATITLPVPATALVIILIWHMDAPINGVYGTTGGTHMKITPLGALPSATWSVVVSNEDTREYVLWWMAK